MSGTAVKERPRQRSAEDAHSYRVAMQVTRVTQYANGDTYPLCPRCNTPMDREYQSYCDRCGQCLSWKGFRKAEVCSL